MGLSSAVDTRKKQSELQTHIAMSGNFSFRVRMKVAGVCGTKIGDLGSCGIYVDGFVPLSKLDAVWNRGQGRKLLSRSFLPLFQIFTAKCPSAGVTLNNENVPIAVFPRPEVRAWRA